MELINNKYKILKKIGSGTFGKIYEAENIRTNEKVAIKLELIKDELKILRYESTIYKILDNIDGVPKIKWYGKDDNYYYMVLDLLGESLEDILKKSEKLSLKIVLQIGINIINILFNIHSKGFIHRDIKPENFLLTNFKPKKIYIIDFGISKSYIYNNKHIEFRLTNKFIGTPNFASIKTHEFYEQSRRDDLESLAYMLIYFYFGELEWMDENNIFENNDEENNYIRNKKKELIKNDNIPNALLEYYNNILKLDFEETPNYLKYINNFKNELEYL